MRLSPCHRAPQWDDKQPRLSQTESQQSCQLQAASPASGALTSGALDTNQRYNHTLRSHTLQVTSDSWSGSTYLTFMAKPEGIIFLGHSKSVEWIRIPDSTNSTAFESGLKEEQNLTRTTATSITTHVGSNSCEDDNTGITEATGRHGDILWQFTLIALYFNRQLSERYGHHVPRLQQIAERAGLRATTVLATI